jgi:hypothetical protein
VSLQDKTSKVREDLNSLGEESKNIQIYVAKSGPNNAIVVIPKEMETKEVSNVLLEKGYTVEKSGNNAFSITW